MKRVVTPELAYFVRDKDGRVAMDVASKPVKQAIQEMLLWHGRYRVTDPQPEHASATCFVFKAIDDRDNKQVHSENDWPRQFSVTITSAIHVVMRTFRSAWP